MAGKRLRPPELTFLLDKTAVSLSRPQQKSAGLTLGHWGAVFKVYFLMVHAWFGANAEAVGLAHELVRLLQWGQTIADAPTKKVLSRLFPLLWTGFAVKAIKHRVP